MFVTSHSAYVATDTELLGAKIDGLIIFEFFFYLSEKKFLLPICKKLNNFPSILAPSNSVSVAT